MSYATIGFGNIGQALAKAFARKGIEVSVATTRDPASFASAGNIYMFPQRKCRICVFVVRRLDAAPGQ